MRSRYSAYALGLSSYIMDTTDPDGPLWQGDREAWGRSIGEFSRGTDFQGLKILKHEGDNIHYYVTFKATLAQGGRDASFTERSAFRREGPRWFYREGAPATPGILGG